MRNIYTAGKVVIFQNKYFKGITPLNHEILQSGGGSGGGMRGFKSFSGSSKSTLLICLIVLYVVIQGL